MISSHGYSRVLKEQILGLWNDIEETFCKSKDSQLKVLNEIRTKLLVNLFKGLSSKKIKTKKKPVRRLSPVQRSPGESLTTLSWTPRVTPS